MVSVFTATYNREHTLNRVFESLKKQTYRDFEWIIVDDGSVDNTRALAEKFIDQANFPISYSYQMNSGKHVAMNRAVRMAKGELFIVADSDDSFIENSIKIFVDAWNSIPEKNRNGFKGITCRCYNPKTARGLGKEFPGKFFDSNDLDINMKHKYKLDMWGMCRTDLLRKYPFPEVKGLAFYPEAVIWGRIARKYKTRFINDTLLAYYGDQENSLTGRNRNRAAENINLWAFYINEAFDYFIYDIPRFSKAFVGLSRDGLILGERLTTILRMCKGFIRKILCIVFLPLAVILCLQQRLKTIFKGG